MTIILLLFGTTSLVQAFAQIRAAHERCAVEQAIAALGAAVDPRRPGPSLFVLSMDHGFKSCPETRIVRAARTLTALAPPETVVEVASMLAHARRPLIVLGAGCRRLEAAIGLLADAAQVPVVTTARAKGLLSERHPWSLRHGGLSASVWAKRYTATPPDVCLALGTDLDDAAVGPTPYVGEGTTLVHVDLDAAAIGRNFPTQLGIVADLGAFAEELAALLRGRKASKEVRAAFAHAVAVSPWDKPRAATDRSVPIRSHRLMCDLAAAMPERARIVSDIGEHTFFALHYLEATAPDSFFLHIDLGSMGSGIGGAIGLAVADPLRPVICIAGDGCVQMWGMEPLVAIKERLPILFVVMNDGRYNIVHHGMKTIFGAAQKYDMPMVDFVGWAKCMGMPARRITRPGQLTRTLVKKLLAHGGPALIDVHLDPNFHIRGGRIEALQQMSLTAVEK